MLGKNFQRNIFIGIVVGIALGTVLNHIPSQGLISFMDGLGDVFLRLLKLIIVPLVFASIFMSVINLKTFDAVGKLGVRAFLYYFLTTGLAVGLGLILVNLIKPGSGTDLATAQMPKVITSNIDASSSVLGSIGQILVSMISSNPFESFAKGNILQVIGIALFFGLIALSIPKESEPIVKLISSFEKLIIKGIRWIMTIAPIGVGCLVAVMLARFGFGAVKSLLLYCTTVTVGLIIHGCVILPMILALAGKANPFKLAKLMIPAIATAFSTSSSAATLPLTMECVKKAGVSEKTADFILPFGATVNMDGTALYESVAVIFIAQAYNIHLPLEAQIVVFITATLAAVGAAAIPSAGLVTMGIVLNAVGLPLEGIGLILAVDRILDMLRTTVNIWGDAVGAQVIDRMK
ncbi:dicarboxylate/amino acid:cation symporter [Elusimicrobiota bacterium]